MRIFLFKRIQILHFGILWEKRLESPLNSKIPFFFIKSIRDSFLTRLYFWGLFCLVVDFFNRINLIYGTVSEYCNETTCPTMSGGPRYEYLWADGDAFKKPTPLPAPKYVEYLMDWTESQINNERYCFFSLPFEIPLNS